jgi:hypothetical protein
MSTAIKPYQVIDPYTLDDPEYLRRILFWDREMILVPDGAWSHEFILNNFVEFDLYRDLLLTMTGSNLSRFSKGALEAITTPSDSDSRYLTLDICNDKLGEKFDSLNDQLQVEVKTVTERPLILELISVAVKPLAALTEFMDYVLGCSAAPWTEATKEQIRGYHIRLLKDIRNLHINNVVGTLPLFKKCFNEAQPSFASLIDYLRKYGGNAEADIFQRDLLSKKQ